MQQQPARTHRAEDMADLLKTLQSSNQNVATITSNDNVYVFAQNAPARDAKQSSREHQPAQALDSKAPSLQAFGLQPASEGSQSQLVLLKQTHQTTLQGDHGAAAAGSPTKVTLGVPVAVQFDEV